VATNYRLARYEYFLSLGKVRILVYDYPGFGKSAGTVSEVGCYRSAKGARQWFQTYLGVSDDANLTYVGRSMGGAVAIEATAGDGTTSVATRLLLQSTFANWGTNIADLFPTLGWALGASMNGRFDSVSRAPRYQRRAGACAYESHSTADEWVPLEQAKELWTALKPSQSAGSCQSAFYEYSGALHDDALTAGEKAALFTWLASARMGRV
jgi:uncharacterized protein